MTFLAALRTPLQHLATRVALTVLVPPLAAYLSGLRPMQAAGVFAISGWIASLYLTQARAAPTITHRGHPLPWHRRPFRYPKSRRYASIFILLIPAGCLTTLAYDRISDRHPSVRIVVADFDGPRIQDFRVTDIVLNTLRSSLPPWITVIPLGRSISEAEGSETARLEAQNHSATLILWGWYAVPNDVALLTAHLEVLRPLICNVDARPGGLRGTPIRSDKREFETFAFQNSIATDVARATGAVAALLRISEQDFRSAIANINYVLGLQDGSTDAIWLKFWRGTAYNSLGDYQHAAADLRDFLKHEPPTPCAVNNFGVAMLYIDRDIARHQFKRAWMQYHLYPARVNLASMYQDDARRGMEETQYSTALSAAERFSLLAPADPASFVDRGTVFALLGDYKRAERDYARAISLSPRTAYIYADRGISRAEAGQYSLALDDFGTALSLGDFEVVSHGLRVPSLLAIGSIDPAIQDLEHVSPDAPAYSKHQLMLGHLYIEKGRVGDAVAPLTRAIDTASSEDIRAAARMQLLSIGRAGTSAGASD